MFNTKLVENISYLKKATYGKVKDSQWKHHVLKFKRSVLQVKLKLIQEAGQMMQYVFNTDRIMNANGTYSMRLDEDVILFILSGTLVRLTV